MNQPLLTIKAVITIQQKNSHWKPNYPDGLQRIARSDRIYATERTLNYVRYFDDYPVSPLKDVWGDTGHSGFSYNKILCGPDCNHGHRTLHTHDYRSRRSHPRSNLWFRNNCLRCRAMGPPVDHHRHFSVSPLTLARARLMGARYPYYLLADSRDGAA